MTAKTYFGAGAFLTIGCALYVAYQRQKSAFQGILQKNVKYDRYQNCIIDLTASQERVAGDRSLFKTGIDDLVKSEKNSKKHMVVIKISREQSCLYEPLIKAGFVGHQANRERTVLTKCLSEHSPGICKYPKYCPILIGVTAVVFNETLEKVLLVQEKHGSTQVKWKPPTGTVEYESGEDPIKAVIRELEEETGIQLKPESAKMTSWYYANNYGIPDHNFTYAFITSDTVPLKAQDGEIAAIQWHSVDKFINEKDDKPWIMRTSVQAAFAALKKQTEWKPNVCYFSSGKPVTILSNL